jgi:ADP-ribose pyrophosphatase
MNAPADGPGPARWIELGRKLITKTRIFELDSVHFLHPGRETDRDFVVLRPPDWVNVLALTPDHQLVLVRQFRYGIKEFTLEIPGGMIDAGEPALVAGQRELLEETGYQGGRAELLGVIAPNPAIQANRCHIVLVQDAVPSGSIAWDTDEEIEVSCRPVDEVLALARNGGITHSLVLSALFLFEARWREMKAERI